MSRNHLLQVTEPSGSGLPEFRLEVVQSFIVELNTLPGIVRGHGASSGGKTVLEFFPPAGVAVSEMDVYRNSLSQSMSGSLESGAGTGNATGDGTGGGVRDATEEATGGDVTMLQASRSCSVWL